MADEQQPHDRMTHMDLLHLFNNNMEALRVEMRETRNEMRWMIGVGFALILLFLAFATFVR